MPEDVTVINTSPLLYLHQIGLLEFLPKLYGTVTAPLAVEQELNAGKAMNIDVPDLAQLPWLEVRELSSLSNLPNVIDLGRGEAEVIALGLDNPNSLLILDDQLGRRIATLYQLRYTGTLGVLIKAKQAGYLNAVAPAIAQLQAQGMWLTDSIIQTALTLACES
jgi:predicted nucleic acid-binding protein